MPHRSILEKYPPKKATSLRSAPPYTLWSPGNVRSKGERRRNSERSFRRGRRRRWRSRSFPFSSQSWHKKDGTWTRNFDRHSNGSPPYWTTCAKLANKEKRGKRRFFNKHILEDFWLVLYFFQYLPSGIYIQLFLKSYLTTMKKGGKKKEKEKKFKHIKKQKIWKHSSRLFTV